MLITRDLIAEQDTLNTLHYLAGVFDGEGHAGIHKGLSRGKYSYMSPRLQVRMCDKEVVDEFPKLLGGRVYKGGVTKNGKQMYQWAVASRKAQTAAFILRPFVRNSAKQVQLERVLGFYDSSAT